MSDTITLEKLEILIDVNTQKLRENLNKIMPDVEKITKRVENTMSKSMQNTEKSMDFTKGMDKLERQLQDLNKNVTNAFNTMAKESEKGATNVSKGVAKGFSQGKKTINKEIDAIVNEINAKMGQAKAQQEKIAFLKAQRQGAVKNGDDKKVVRYDEQIARAEAAMTKYHDSAIAMANSIKQEFESVPTVLDDITAQMDKNEKRIETYRAKLEQLKAQYQDQIMPTGSFQEGFTGTKDSKSSLKTSQEIAKNEKAMGKLVSENDRLMEAYGRTEDRAEGLRTAVKRLNTTLGETGSYDNAEKSTETIGNKLERQRKKIGGFFSRFEGASRKSMRGMGRANISSPFEKAGRTLRGFTRRLLIAGAAYRVFASGGRYMLQAMKTNDQFNRSLNEIRVNLTTAFYPIYTAVMPAINTLVSGISKATAYLATFIATLFGTTYSAAKSGAQGLQNDIVEMESAGDTADKTKNKVKKLQRVLMGFDEINRLEMPTDDDDDSLLPDTPKHPSNVPDINYNIADPDVPSWVSNLANTVKKIAKDLFVPIKNAWDKDGQKVMDAWKYATYEIGRAAQSVGRDFMKVWTNGTGERFISNILILLADMLNIVGDIHRAFRIAWDDNGRGKRLIQSFFDMLNAILELIHEIAKSWRKAWNSGVGVSIMSHILSIATKVNERIANMANSFKRAWKEGEVGTSIFKTLLGMVDDMLAASDRMTAADAKWAKELDFTPLLKSIDSLLKPIRKITKKIWDGLDWGYQNILLPLSKFTIEEVLPRVLEGIGNGLEIINSVLDTAREPLQWLWDSFLQPIASWTGDKFVGALDAVNGALKTLGGWIDEHNEGFSFFVQTLTIFAATLATIAGVSKVITVITGIVGALSGIGGLSGMISLVTGGLGALITMLGGPLVVGVAVAVAAGVMLYKNWDTIKEKATQLKEWVSQKWEGLKKSTSETWENIKRTTAEKWGNTKDSISTSAETAKKNATKAWETLKSNVTGFNNEIKTHTKEAFGKVVSWATGLPNKIKDGLLRGVGAVKSAAKEIGRGIYEFPLKAVNGVISGVQWVLKLVGAKDAAKSMSAYKFAYAQGTGYHSGGPALVNDGSGMNYQEAYRLPNGQSGLFPKQRNLLVNLPAGSSVLSGPRTASMMSGKVPKYAGGVGKWFKEKWEGVKDFTGDVWDYMSEPSKLVEIGVSKFTNLKGAIEPALSLSKGVISSSMTAATSYVKEKMSEFFSNGDADTTSTGIMGVMSYLSDIAKDVMKKFPGMVATSGYRHGDPYFHGKRQAIDIAYPANMNGSSEYFKPANYAFEKFRDKVAYVITQGKVRDRAGISGQPATSNWVNWPDNDHYDHLHINGSLSQGQVQNQAGGGAPSGSGAERWRPSILRSARMMNQTINPGEVNGIIAQIHRESGGNDKIMQQAWDENMAKGTPAQGLLQYVPSTFNAYKVRGFGNILNGYHQLMAFFNNTNWRYDLPYGRSGWSPNGGRVKPYENGGIIDKEGLYRLGEGNKREMVIPLEKPSLAAKMIEQAMEYINMTPDVANFGIPDVFKSKPTTFESTPIRQTDNSNSFIQNLTQSLATTIQANVSNGSNEPTNVNVTLEVDGDVLAKQAITGINKTTQRTGKFPLYI